MDNLLMLFRLPLIWMATPRALAPQGARAHSGYADAPDLMPPHMLGKRLAVGDIVFIRVSVLPFEKVSSTTCSWTNHVGIVIDVGGKEPLIAESRFPLSCTTTWSRFVARSENGRVAVSRLGFALDQQQCDRLREAAAARSGILYDTGFDLYSRRQFCSRYVREVMRDATGITIGHVENFSELLSKNPHADLAFWRIWYFGYIPWQRKTVTPASMLNDPVLRKMFDGHVYEPSQRHEGGAW